MSDFQISTLDVLEQTQDASKPIENEFRSTSDDFATSRNATIFEKLSANKFDENWFSLAFSLAADGRSLQVSSEQTITEEILQDETSNDQKASASWKPWLCNNIVSAAIQTVKEKGASRFMTWLDKDCNETSVYTFEDVWRESGIIAANLKTKLMLNKGDRVLLCYSPGPQFFIAFWACLRVGVIAVPVYPPNPAKMKMALQKLDLVRVASGARICLTDAQVNRARLITLISEKWPSGLEWHSTERFGSNGMDGSTSGFLDCIPSPTDIAFIQFTSGSTGDPKGVVIDHACLWHNGQIGIPTHLYGCQQGHLYGCQQGMEGKPLNRDDLVCVSWVPQYHDMGLIAMMLCSFVLGQRYVGMSPIDFLFDPLIWATAISKYRGTSTAGPTFAYGHLIGRLKALNERQKQALGWDLSSLMYAACGAERPRDEILLEFEQELRCFGFRGSILTVYGLAEHCVFVTMCVERHRVHAKGSRSHLVSCGERGKLAIILKIVDPATFAEVEDGKPGEIWLSSGSVARGYWGLPELSDQVFRARMKGDDKNYYLRTGDEGFIEDGHFFVGARIKDMVIVAGKNYYPEDIELAAFQSAPSIIRPSCIAAFAVETGQEAELVIVFEIVSGMEFRAEAATRRIANAIVKEIGITPSRIVAIKTRSIPKTSSGKLQRRATQASLLKGVLPIVFDTFKDADIKSAVPSTQKDNICIIGAGPGGLSLAYFLQKRGFSNITVFESEPVVGGKATGVYCADLKKYVGSGQYTVNKSYALTSELAAKFNVEIYGREFLYALQVFDPETKTFSLASEATHVIPSRREVERLAKSGLERLADGVDRLPGTGFERLYTDQTLSLNEFLEVNGVDEKESSILMNRLNLYAPAGYTNTLSKLPAAYWLRLAQYGEDWSFVAPDGYLQLCMAMAGHVSKVEGTKLFLKTPVTKIQRDADGVLVSAGGEVHRFQKLIISAHLTDVISLMDATDEERDLAKQIVFTDYDVTIASLKGVPALTYIPKHWSHDSAGRVFMVSKANYENTELGLHDSEKPQLYSVFQYGSNYETGARLSDEDLKIAMFEDLALMGATVVAIHGQRRWNFFPHVSTDDLQNGFYDQLAAIQGHKNTYYAGSTLNFELVEATIRFSKHLAQHISVKGGDGNLVQGIIKARCASLNSPISSPLRRSSSNPCLAGKNPMAQDSPTRTLPRVNSKPRFLGDVAKMEGLGKSIQENKSGQTGLDSKRVIVERTWAKNLRNFFGTGRVHITIRSSLQHPAARAVLWVAAISNVEFTLENSDRYDDFEFCQKDIRYMDFSLIELFGAGAIMYIVGSLAGFAIYATGAFAMLFSYRLYFGKTTKHRVITDPVTACVVLASEQTPQLWSHEDHYKLLEYLFWHSKTVMPTLSEKIFRVSDSSSVGRHNPLDLHKTEGLLQEVEKQLSRHEYIIAKYPTTADILLYMEISQLAVLQPSTLSGADEKPGHVRIIRWMESIQKLPLFDHVHSNYLPCTILQSLQDSSLAMPSKISDNKIKAAHNQESLKSSRMDRNMISGDVVTSRDPFALMNHQGVLAAARAKSWHGDFLEFMTDWDSFVRSRVQRDGTSFLASDHSGETCRFLTDISDIHLMFDTSATAKCGYLGPLPMDLFRNSQIMNDCDHDLRKQWTIDFLHTCFGSRDLVLRKVVDITKSHISKWGKEFEQLQTLKGSKSTLDLKPFLNFLVCDILSELLLQKPAPSNLVNICEACLLNFVDQNSAQEGRKMLLSFLKAACTDIKGNWPATGISEIDAYEQLASTFVFAAYAGLSKAIQSIFGEIFANEGVLKNLSSLENSSKYDVKDLSNRVILESLRLHPPVAYITARARRTLLLNDGVTKVLEGELLKADFHHALRSSSVFQNPDKFDYDRDDHDDLIENFQANPAILFALGDGASGRKCPAKNLALSILEGITNTVFGNCCIAPSEAPEWDTRNFELAKMPKSLRVKTFYTLPCLNSGLVPRPCFASKFMTIAASESGGLEKLDSKNVKEICRDLVKIISEITDVTVPDSESKLDGLGLTSLMAVKLQSRIVEKFQFVLQISDFSIGLSIEDIAHKIAGSYRDVDEPCSRREGNEIQEVRTPGWTWEGVFCPFGVIHHHVALPGGVVMHVAEMKPAKAMEQPLPLMLLHGFPECSYSWVQLMEPLAQQFRIIVPDLRGFGETLVKRQGGLHGDYTISSACEDLLQLLDVWAIDKISLVGHDLGAIVAWSFALMYPDRHRGIASIGIPHDFLHVLGVDSQASQAVQEQQRSLPPIQRLVANKANSTGGSYVGQEWEYMIQFSKPDFGFVIESADPKIVLAMLYSKDSTVFTTLQAIPSTLEADRSLLPHDLEVVLLRGMKINPLIVQLSFYQQLDISFARLCTIQAEWPSTERSPCLLISCGTDRLSQAYMFQGMEQRCHNLVQVHHELWTHWCCHQVLTDNAEQHTCKLELINDLEAWMQRLKPSKDGASDAAEGNGRIVPISERKAFGVINFGNVPAGLQGGQFRRISGHDVFGDKWASKFRDHPFSALVNIPGRIEQYQLFHDEKAKDLALLVSFGTRSTGSPGFVHGGLISFLFDDLFGWCQLVNKLSFSLTEKLQINYHKAIQVGSGPVLLRAKINQMMTNGQSLIELKGSATNSSNTVEYATASASFVYLEQAQN